MLGIEICNAQTLIPNARIAIRNVENQKQPPGGWLLPDLQGLEFEQVLRICLFPLKMKSPTSNCRALSELKSTYGRTDAQLYALMSGVLPEAVFGIADTCSMRI